MRQYFLRWVDACCSKDLAFIVSKRLEQSKREQYLSDITGVKGPRQVPNLLDTLGSVTGCE